MYIINLLETTRFLKTCFNRIFYKFNSVLCNLNWRWQKILLKHVFTKRSVVLKIVTCLLLSRPFDVTNSVDKTKFLCTTPPPTQHHSFFRNYPLYSVVCWYTNRPLTLTLSHLCGTDDWLSILVTPTNHHLLRQKYFFWGNFNSQVSSCHHNAISCMHDFIKSPHSFVILNLGNNLDFRAFCAKHLAYLTNILSFANKWSEYHVHL